MNEMSTRTGYRGISTFLIYFHLEQSARGANRLRQLAELREARAHANSSNLDEYSCALTYRSSQDWMSYRVIQSLQKPLSTLGFRIFLRSLQKQEWKRLFTERPARSGHGLMGRMVSSDNYSKLKKLQINYSNSCEK